MATGRSPSGAAGCDRRSFPRRAAARLAPQVVEAVRLALVIRVTAGRSARRVLPAAHGRSLDAAPPLDAQLRPTMERRTRAAAILVRVTRVPRARTTRALKAERVHVEDQFVARRPALVTGNGKIVAAEEAARSGPPWATFETRAHGVDQLVYRHNEVAVDIDGGARIERIHVQKDARAADDLADPHPPVTITITGAHRGATGARNEPRGRENGEQREPCNRRAHGFASQHRSRFVNLRVGLWKYLRA